MIGVYDKGYSDSTFIQDIKKYAGQETQVYEEQPGLQTCEIAIVHILTEDWKELIARYSCPGRVRVRVSTVGFTNTKSPSIENGVYTFHLVPSTENLKTEWKEILWGLSDKLTVDALVRGENPEGLGHFFVHKVQDYLPALTLLCEGYLAVHIEAKTCHTDIHQALDLMGWTTFRKSDRSKDLIQADLGDKKDNVQHPKWWLKVLEQESLYDNMKKEWEAAGGGEMPDTLNYLLNTIFEGKAVEPPKIVADAYCILVENKTRTVPSEWQTRRNKFNHDWLKNKFLNSFDDFVVQLKKPDPNILRVSEFLAEDFPDWVARRQDAQWIVNSFEDRMSPRRLLDSSPLNRSDGETKEWLGHLVHELWLSRYQVKSKAKESQDALVAIDKQYEKVASEVEQSKPIGLTKLIALHPQFCRLKKAYQELSKTLSDLPRYELHDR